ncbi:MAG TPA: glutathione peroxidase [Hyphomonas sp.]|nr:glutathione peroxidase [Hyphomonas sp.]HRJ02125.1 glutathione peroxidase [Hyphomonas sp.]HRK68239.1 glutathione peroxidase [Hyphomonas sp.]
MKPVLTALIAACLAAAACGAPAASEQPAASSQGVPMTATQFTSIDGKPMDLTALGAKAVLVVNTASKCGFTPQYKGLQALYEDKKDEGLIIVGVPSNDFMGQEPGTEEEVKTFCEINYGVTFPLTKKYHVKGKEAHPFYSAAKAAIGKEAEPGWNFHKILIKGDGTPVKAYGSKVKPEDKELAADIDAILKG